MSARPSVLTTETTQQRIDEYWANYLGCQVEDLHAAGTRTVFSERYPGIFGLMVGQARVYSIHPALQPFLADPGFFFTPPGEFSPAAFPGLVARAGLHVQETYGPGWLTYCDPASFRPRDDRSVCILDDTNAAEIGQLAEVVGWSELFRENSSQWIARFGLFQDRELASVAMLRAWGRQIGSLTVATRPECRGRGCASQVVSRATRWLFEETDLVPQYDTALHNLASLRVAHGLGYRTYGQIVYVRLVSD